MAKLVFKGKEDFGTLGERTPLRDRYGRVLHIGDVVLVATTGAHMFNIVVKDKEQGYFVMGWGHKYASKKDRRSFEDIIRVDDPSLTEILETKYANIIELVEEFPKQNKVDTIEFKIEDKKTIVDYNGAKGVAQCHPTKDEYNKEIGITLATMRALGIDEGKVRDCANILLGIGSEKDTATREKYIFTGKETLAIHCSTFEEYKELQLKLFDLGYYWYSDDPKELCEVGYKEYESDVCIEVNEGLKRLYYCYTGFFIREGYKIVEYSDVVFKEKEEVVAIPENIGDCGYLFDVDSYCKGEFAIVVKCEEECNKCMSKLNKLGFQWESGGEFNPYTSYLYTSYLQSGTILYLHADENKKITWSYVTSKNKIEFSKISFPIISIDKEDQVISPIVNIQEDKGVTIESLRELIREEVKKELQNLNKR